MKDVSGMTADELQEYLSKLRADLEEIEEERRFVFGQTGLHVSGGAVKKYETEVNDLRTKIEEVEQVVHANNVGQTEVVGHPSECPCPGLKEPTGPPTRQMT
jgi:hypothetical protein